MKDLDCFDIKIYTQVTGRRVAPRDGASLCIAWLIFWLIDR